MTIYYRVDDETYSEIKKIMFCLLLYFHRSRKLVIKERKWNPERIVEQFIGRNIQRKPPLYLSFGKIKVFLKIANH